MTRRAKLQAALESDIDAASVLRQFTADGGSGIDGAVDALFNASKTPKLTRRAKLQVALDSLDQSEAASIVADNVGGIDGAINALFASV